MVGKNRPCKLLERMETFSSCVNRMIPRLCWLQANGDAFRLRCTFRCTRFPVHAHTTTHTLILTSEALRDRRLRGWSKGGLLSCSFSRYPSGIRISAGRDRRLFRSWAHTYTWIRDTFSGLWTSPYHFFPPLAAWFLINHRTFLISHLYLTINNKLGLVTMASFTREIKVNWIKFLSDLLSGICLYTWLLMNYRQRLQLLYLNSRGQKCQLKQPVLTLFSKMSCSLSMNTEFFSTTFMQC